jgi:hypothetical protein
MQEEVERPTIEDVFEYDLEVSVNEIPDVIETLKKYAPYGNTNERIIFKVNNYELSPRQSSYFTKLGEDESTVKLYGVDMTAIGFGLTQAYLDAGEPKNVELVGYIGQSTYFGKTSTQIEFKDFQPIIKSKPMSKFQEAMARAKAERYS